MKLEITYAYATHKSGTKFYRTIMVKSPNGASGFIAQYGKVGVYGRVSVERHYTNPEVESAYFGKIKDKTKDGYEFEGKSFSLNTVSDRRDIYDMFVRHDLGQHHSNIEELYQHLGVGSEATFEEATERPASNPAVSLDIPMSGGDW